MSDAVIVSFSGGKTSAYMTRKMLDVNYNPNMRFVFMNTGCEGEETLRFVDRCDHEWGLNVVWLEAVVYPDKGNGTSYKVVSYETAARNGEPFEAVIQKYGIPNSSYPHCTRELKLRVFYAWAADNMPTDNWLAAIGIRADESRRVKAEPRVIYPLVFDFPTTKAMVNDWWEEQPFTLGLPSYMGNCTWCWKKTTSKLIRIANEKPGAFDFPLRMEREYRDVGTEKDPSRVFFRQYRSAEDILRIAELADRFRPYSLFDEDEDAGCSESCEVFA